MKYEQRQRKHFLFTLCVFILLLSLWWLAVRWYRGYLINEKRAEVASLVNINGNSLSSNLMRQFALIEGLRAFIKTEVRLKGSLGQDNFDNFASGLYAGAKGIRVIQAMPGGVVRFVYPIAGNEKTLGHDILSDLRTEVREDVKRAISTREIALSNPYELRQGGLGVVERLAVYKSDGTFWGLSVIVLDVPPLLDAAGIILPESIVELSLRDKSGRVFHGREDVFLSEPVIYRVELPDGYWELAGIPKEGWKSSIQTSLIAFQGICLIIVLLLTGIVYIVSGRQISLATAVRQRTSELDLELEKRKKSEEKLLETTKYNRMLFEQSTIGLALCRMDGTLVDVNEAYANIIGRTVEETFKLTYWDITPEKYAVQEQEQLENLKTTGRYGPYEKEYIHKSGRFVPIKLHGRIIEQNGEKMIWSSVDDITERKRMEYALKDREAQLHLFVQYSPAAIAMFDREMKYIVASRRWLTDYNLGDIQITGRSHYDIFPDIPERWKEIHKRCLAGAVEMCEEDPFSRADGSIDWVRWEVHPWKHSDDRIGGLIIFSEVITERKQAEQELIKHREHLKQLVTEQTAGLEEARKALMNIVEDLNDKSVKLEDANIKLKELDRLKSMFIASMSHELRTPLNSIIGFSSILLNEWVGPMTPEQKDNLGIVLKSGRHLLALINDVIDISKIEAEKIEVIIEEFDLYDLVSEAASAHIKDMQNKGLDFRLDSLPQTINTDRRRLLQCIHNLMSNAVKFTEKGSVSVRTRVVDKGDFVEISVVDTGIGIKEEDLPKLFLPFIRLDSPLKATVSGTGLGLYLTKKLVNQVLKGEIEVKSKFSEGSGFKIIIPVGI